MAKAPLALGLVGCGGMGLRHIQGLVELQRAGISPFELIAVCDARPEAAVRAADMAEEGLGRRPEIHTGLDALLAGPTGRLMDAVDLVTDVGAHHSVGVKVLEAGKHLISEKPLGLTVKACRVMLDAAARSGAVLATAENYRRDPINRLVAALLQSGAIGRPFMAMQESVGGGRNVTITPWRHYKDRGGIVIDMGVHYTDLWLYFLGPIERIGGRVALFEPLRNPVALSGGMAAFYAGSAYPDEPVRATAEDTSIGQVTFANGAIGQLLLSLAGHGEGYFLRRFYGSEGAMDAPSDRSGRPIRLARNGAAQSGFVTLDDAEARSLLPEFTLDDPTSRLFGASMLTSYDLPFEAIDRKLLALELEDFGRAVIEKRAPEVDGQGGLDAVAAMYAFFESSLAGRDVTLAEVAGGAVDAYQRDIDLALGLSEAEARS
jgi:predicted dehydrogenase